MLFILKLEERLGEGDEDDDGDEKKGEEVKIKLMIEINGSIWGKGILIIIFRFPLSSLSILNLF